MKRKNWIWLCLIAVILLGAFLFPKLLIWIEQLRAEEQVLTYGTGTLLNFEELGLAEKQQLLASGDLAVLGDIGEEPDADQSILPAFFKELDKLYEYGAIDVVFYNVLTELFFDSKAEDCIAYDSLEMHSFRYYAVTSAFGDAYAYVDAETGKILSLCCRYYAEEILFSGTNDTKGDSTYEAQIRSWAEYYGMTVESLRNYDFSESADYAAGEVAPIVSCTLRDGAGIIFRFGLTFHVYENGLFWQSLNDAEGFAQMAEAE